MSELGRNDPCPCGSGKKYKRCCINVAVEHAYSGAALDEEIRHAIELHNAGNLEKAAVIYRRVLQVAPNHLDALHLLGMIAHQNGEHELALNLIGKAITASPPVALLYSNIGQVFLSLGRFDEALANYLRALELKPDSAEIYTKLGLLYDTLGRTDDAITHHRKSLDIKSDYAEAHYNLGNSLVQQGKLLQAIPCFQEAIRHNPFFPEAYNNLGLRLIELGRAEEALPYCRQAILQKPDLAEAHCNLGAALERMGHLDEAVTQSRKGLELRPDYPGLHYNLGCSLAALGRLDEALDSYQKAVELNPYHLGAYINQASVLKGLGRLDEAIFSCQKALAIDPNCANAYGNLGNVLSLQGKHEAAIHSFRHALKLQPDHAISHNSLLLTMQYFPAASAADIYAEHLRFAERHEGPLKHGWTVHANARDPDKRLKVGYVSADFRTHAVSYFIESILANHDKSQVELYCYHNSGINDGVTKRLMTFPDHWIACQHMTEKQLAERIRADGIDILVDLSGHTHGNRLLAFARKPAPVQLTWIGYAGTTGLSAMDYRLTDAYLDPPGLTEKFHSEKLVRLSASAMIKSDGEAPLVNRLPALENGHLTFSCLNSAAKITAATVSVWARILHALPTAKIMLGNASGSVAEKLKSDFARHGIAADRLLLRPRLPMRQYLTLYHQIDLALDPFPYNGGTTTVHAMWMGVPVLTLAGDRTASRSGTSLMMYANLPEFIAHTEEEYIEKAVWFAHDLVKLDEIRLSLRGRIEANPANEPIGFTREVESAYRRMWKEWCTTHVAEPA